MNNVSPRAAGALLLWLGLAACAAGDAGAAWPPPWSGRDDLAQQGAIDFSPPVFSAPRADHCRRAPTLRETHADAVRHRSRRWEGDALASGPVARDRAAPPPAEAAAVELPRISIASKAAGLAERRSDRAQPDPGDSVAPSQRPFAPRPSGALVQAGMVDDNADFGAYLAYRARHAGLPVRERDIAERYLLQVSDAHGRPVHDAEVAVQRAGVAEPLTLARTDTSGKVWLHPRAFVTPGDEPGPFGIAVRKGTQQARATLRRGQANAVQVRLDAPATGQRARLDLVFMIDATGSMADEIAKLEASMRQIAAQIAELPSRPELCYALVAYRDRGDAFLTRSFDFTDDLGAFQAELARLQAAGGGDYPEALNEALHEVVHGLAWRRDAARMVVLVADAPPHLDYGGPQYDRDMQAALAKGIKVFAVGASGLDPVGEYVFRQIAQYTAGRFVFLTYKDAANPGRGAGTQTSHDVSNYSVDTLDRLVVRLVSEEMARLGRG